MATILLDDSVIQDVLQDRKSRVELLRRLLEEGHMLACCAPTIAEIHAQARPGRAASALLDSLEYLTVTAATAKLAGQLRRSAGRRQEALSPDDAITGALAVVKRCSLLTDRSSRYPIEALSIYPAIPKAKHARV